MPDRKFDAKSISLILAYYGWQLILFANFMFGLAVVYSIFHYWGILIALIFPWTIALFGVGGVIVRVFQWIFY